MSGCSARSAPAAGPTRPYPFDLHDLFLTWRNLEAWERPVNAVLWVARSDREESTGWANQETGEILVTAGTDEADGYATLLHELAHLAVGWQTVQHTPRWRAAFLDAAEEVLGRRPRVFRWDRFGVAQAVADAFANCPTVSVA
jgi:hypothetical protein